MKLYHLLSTKGLLKNNYAMKFLVVLFPLVLVILSLFIFLVFEIPYIKFIVILGAVIVLSTVIGAYFNYRLFRQLISPLKAAKIALDEYEQLKKLPDLPLNYTDEAGQLLHSIQLTITKMDRLIGEKTDLIDLLSHDLRSPLGRILSLADLIKLDTEANKELYCNYITKECKGLLRMLENMLVMLKEDQQVYQLSYVSLRHIIQETVGFFEFQIEEKKLDLRMNIEESIFVNVQQDLFVQSVRNIIGNSIKFSPDGKKILIVGKRELDRVHLSIIDEGIGFKQLEMQQLFERFTKAGKEGTKGEASTGLGLYLSKKIVERHGGQLLAESAGINKGATFTIVLNSLVIKKPQETSSKR